MAGSKVAQTVVKGAQKVRDKAVEVVKSSWSTVKSAVSDAVRIIGALF